MDVSHWLQQLGLGAYIPAFRANHIDADVLPNLTHADLDALGIRSMGHRYRLLGAIRTLAADPPAQPPPDPAERRQITIMFCDLVGSTALAARLDPEDLRTVHADYHRVVAAQIARFDGFVAKYMGDGVLVYFGFPRAHEDDAERAVRAGLEVLAAAERIRLPSGRLRLRIGLATGRVVVGDVIGEGAAQEHAAIGATPNLAARLQELAPPGTLVVASATRNLLGGLFRLRDLGPQTLKGIDQPVEAWVVEAALVPASRFEVTRRVLMADMVGRTAERREMAALRRRAWAGEGQVMLISGEPGIGKSRLATWICDDSSKTPHRRIRYQSSQYHRDSPFYPMINQIRNVGGLLPGDTPAVLLEKLTRLIATAMPDPEPIVQVFAGMLEIPGDRPASTPAQQRAQILAAVLELLTSVARLQPLLILFEDVHWADATSLEVLHAVIDTIRALPVLMVVTARPEFQERWQDRPNVTICALDRLDQHSIRVIVNHAASTARLSPAAIERIVAKAEGIPLFAEELTRSALEKDPPASRHGDATLAVPDTLHDLLMARLDSMGSAKEVAQIGAVIGREFPAALLREMHGHPESLEAGLTRLQEAALVFGRGEPPDMLYTFKHALVQDAAYDSLLRSRRAVLHRQIAEILSEPRAGRDPAESEIVAQHYARAGLLEEAIRWWSRASERALLRSAYREAISHFENALSAIETLGEDRIELKLLLKLQIDYSQALIACRGYNAPETFAAFVRAYELATRIKDPRERFSIFYGLWSNHFVRGDVDAMTEVALAFLAAAAERPDAPETGVAHRCYGVTLWFSGDLVRGRHHLERAVATYDPVRDRQLAYQFGQDVGLSALMYAALAQWPLGDVERAGHTLEKAQTLGLGLSQEISVAYVHFYSALFQSMRLAPGLAAPSLHALDTVTKAHGLTFWNRAGQALQGWVDCHQGRHETGMQRIRDGVVAYIAQGFGSIVPQIYVLQADVARTPAEIAAALGDIDQCLLQIGPGGKHWLQAELQRMRGVLLLRQDPRAPEQAEAAFRAALGTAQAQRTRSFALRAALCLAELLGVAAAPVLHDAVAGFTDGAIFPEVTRARHMLEAFAGATAAAEPAQPAIGYLPP